MKHGVVGDKKIIYRSEVVKKYPHYPIFKGEKFVPLYLPIIIDRDFSLLVFNEIFCVVEYLEDGSTLNIYDQYFKNPKGFKYLRKIELEYLTIKAGKFKSAIQFYFFKNNAKGI